MEESLACLRGGGPADLRELVRPLTTWKRRHTFVVQVVTEGAMLLQSAGRVATLEVWVLHLVWISGACRRRGGRGLGQCWMTGRRERGSRRCCAARGWSLAWPAGCVGGRGRGRSWPGLAWSLTWWGVSPVLVFLPPQVSPSSGWVVSADARYYLLHSGASSLRGFVNMQFELFTFFQIDS